MGGIVQSWQSTLIPTLVAGCARDRFQNPVKGKLKYVPKWKEDTERAIQIMTKGWELVKIKLRDMGKDGGAST